MLIDIGCHVVQIMSDRDLGRAKPARIYIFCFSGISNPSENKPYYHDLIINKETK